MFGGQQVCVLLITPFHIVIHYRKQILYWPLIQKMKSYDTLYTMSVITLKILNKPLFYAMIKRLLWHTRDWPVIWTLFLLCISLCMLNRTIRVVLISCLLRLEFEGLLQSVLSLQVSVAKPY